MSPEEVQVEEAYSGPIVIGIGASAGGLEAMSALLRGVPSRLGAAMVFVTHLGPQRESLLTDILRRETNMPVMTAEDGVTIEADHIYVQPPGYVMTMEGHRLRLQRLEDGTHQRNAVDVFFASMARVVREASIGVVLSGAGSDGTLGLKAIKEEGGFTIAQGHDGTMPQHESMPASAIASGVVDLSLAAENMGAKLESYIRSFTTLQRIADEDGRQVGSESTTSAIRDICDTLRKRVGHDFEGYKEKTFMRRVQRRMQVMQVQSLTEYSDRLREDAEEAGCLFRDLLIGVTSFFRDEEAFQAISRYVIPKLFEGCGANDIVRVWVPGCATGEEAYSIAILLREYIATLAQVPRVQVFATDIDEAALSVARAGRYPAAVVGGVSEERRRKFFREEAQSYTVAKELRDLCIFSAHSVIRDPPFSRMDFVSCRNLLIYFNVDLQDSVLPVFHYALKPDGFLFLGTSENISRHTDLFAPVDKKQRIFQRRSMVNGGMRMPAWVARTRSTRTEGGHDMFVQKDQRIRQQVETRVLESFTPAHIVVDAEGDILYYSARTGKYLEPQMGSPSRQLLSMARRGLRLELRSALREAVEKRHVVVRERIAVELEDRVQLIRLTVDPMLETNQEPLYLIVFADLGPPVTHEEAAQHTSLRGSQDFSSLEQELKDTRDRLQATIEEYETALEELKSGNEELVSVNEELQSTNEELETSKEELQSVNEELHTVNQELAARVDELHRTNADMRNLFESTQIATVFLDRFMIIRSYTPAVTAIFNLISSDRGRPITDIAHQLEDVDLRRDIRQVIDERKAIERPVRLRNGKVFHLMRILPYRGADDEIDGALVTFVNVTAVVVAEEQQRLLVAELNHRVRNMLQVVMGLANQSLHRSQDLQQFGKAFFGRMQALARAYELLSRDGWHKVPVAELIRTQLSPFAAEGKRYTTTGDTLVLTANAALSLGLVVYELATNATKYGALASPTGQIGINWRIENSPVGHKDFVLRWCESGGPAVRPPSRQGFGSELVQRQLKYELNGTAELNFAETGIEVTLTIPMEEAIDAVGESP